MWRLYSDIVFRSYGEAEHMTDVKINKSHTLVAVLKCSTLIVWCSNLKMGRVVVLFCTYWKRQWLSNQHLFIFYYFLKEITDAKDTQTKSVPPSCSQSTKYIVQKYVVFGTHLFCMLKHDMPVIILVLVFFKNNFCKRVHDFFLVKLFFLLFFFL